MNSPFPNVLIGRVLDADGNEMPGPQFGNVILPDMEINDPQDVATIQNKLDYIVWEPTVVSGIGRIITAGSQAEAFVLDRIHTTPNCVVVREPARFGLDYFDVQAGKVMPRQESTARLDGFVLRDLPPGAEIRIGFERYNVEGSEIELEFDMPGTYTVTVEGPMHFPAQFTVEWTRPA